MLEELAGKNVQILVNAFVLVGKVKTNVVLTGTFLKYEDGNIYLNCKGGDTFDTILPYNKITLISTMDEVPVLKPDYDGGFFQ